MTNQRTLSSSLMATGGAGNDVFSVTAGKLSNAVFRGGAGTDTVKLIGGGTFYLPAATFSSIENIQGTAQQDIIVIDRKTLAGVKTIKGGGGGDILMLDEVERLDFRGKSISGFTRIEADSKRFEAIFDNKATALLVWAKASQNDSLTLVGGTFTEAERAQLHFQGVDNITDDSGTYTNLTPRVYHLDGDKTYTTHGRAFFDRDRDVTIDALDDKLASLTVIFENDLMKPGAILIANDLKISLPDGLSAGGSILFDGTAIGTIESLNEYGINIVFNGDATKVAVEALMRSLAFENLDPDPTPYSVLGTIVLMDEGGRYSYSQTEILAGGRDVQFLDRDVDNLLGTDANETFATDEISLNEGDVLQGGNGTDTLVLLQGGAFDLRKFETFQEIERIVGSDRGDAITLRSGQLGGLSLIDGGEESDDGTVTDSSNFLNIEGTNIDLTNIEIKNFSAISLLSDGAVVRLTDKSVANKISGLLTENDRIELVGGVFTAAEIGALFRHGIETVVDDSGGYLNSAPRLDGFSDEPISGIAGHEIFIDADRHVTVHEDDQAFSSLTVSVEGGTATDRLGVASIGKVQVIEVAGGIQKIYVNGIYVGFITTPKEGGPLLSIQFSDKSAPSLVQEVIRALTYKDATQAKLDPSEIKITLTDYTNHSTQVSVTIEQELNEKPTDIVLDGSLAAELSANGTLVGVLSTVDSNKDDSFSYTLLNDAGGRFALKGNMLVVNQGFKLDYEQAQSHSITVRVTDQLGQTFDKTFSIDVGDVPDEVAVGSSGRDAFVGGAGNDRFYGKLGNDTFKGGAGLDIFVFDTKLGSANVDSIRDFNVKDDTIWLSRSIFTKAGRAGTLSKNAFWTGAKAHDASDRILYNKDTGALSFDADGNGAGRAIKFAQLTAGLKLTAADFALI